MGPPCHVTAPCYARPDTLVNRRDVENAVHVASDGLRSGVLQVANALNPAVGAPKLKTFPGGQPRKFAALRVVRRGLPQSVKTVPNDVAFAVAALRAGLTDPTLSSRRPTEEPVTAFWPCPPLSYSVNDVRQRLNGLYPWPVC